MVDDAGNLVTGYLGAIGLTTTDTNSPLHGRSVALDTSSDGATILEPLQAFSGPGLFTVRAVSNDGLTGELTIHSLVGAEATLVAVSGVVDQTIAAGQAPANVLVRMLTTEGAPVANAPVYLDRGAPDAQSAGTNSDGEALFSMTAFHGVGVQAVTVSSPASNSLSFTVTTAAPEPPRDQEQAAVGRIYHSRTGEPLAGVTVTARGTPGAVTSNDEGVFRFPIGGFRNADLRRQVVLTFHKDGFVDAHRSVAVMRTRENAARPVRLAPLSRRVTVVGPFGGVVSDESGAVRLDIPAGALDQPTAFRVTSLQSESELPELPPEDWRLFVAGVNLQPHGLRFNGHIGVVLRTHSREPAADLHVGVWDSESYTYQNLANATMGGGRVEYQTSHFSDHVISIPTIPPCQEDYDDWLENLTCEPRDPGVGLVSGTFATSLTLATCQVGNRPRPVTLSYDSQTVAPTNFLSVSRVAQEGASSGAPAVTASLGGEWYESAEAPAASGSQTSTMVRGRGIDGRALDTGAYPADVTVISSANAALAGADSYGAPNLGPIGPYSTSQVPVSQSSTGPSLVVNNQVESDFGAGWGIDGVDQVVRQPDGSAVLARGDGTAAHFTTPMMDWASYIPRGAMPDCDLGWCISPLGYSTEDVAFDAAGTAYIAGTFGLGVELADTTLPTDVGWKVLEWPLGFPTAVDVDVETAPGGRVYVTGTFKGFPALLQYLHPEDEWDDGEWSVIHSDFTSVGGLATDRDGNVYVSDPQTGQILVHNQVTTLPIISGLNHPTTLAISPDGWLYVVTRRNGGGLQISRYLADPDSSCQAGNEGVLLNFNELDNDLAFGPGGTLFLSLRDAQSLYWINVEEGDFGELLRGVPFTGIAFDPAGEMWTGGGLVNGRGYGAQIASILHVSPTLGEGGETQLASPPNEDVILSETDDGYIAEHPDGSSAEFGEDGTLQAEVDPNGNETEYIWETGPDGEPQLAEIEYPDAGSVSFTYDGEGRLDSVTDCNGAVTQVAHDEHGNLTEFVSSDGVRQGFAYDENHLLVTHTSPTGVLQLEHDDGIYTGMTIGDDRTIALEPAASRTGADGSAGTTTARVGELGDKGMRGDWEMDRFGRPLRFTDLLGRVTEWERNESGDPLSIRYPTGHQIEYRYDDAANLSRTIDHTDGTTETRGYVDGTDRLDFIEDADGTEDFVYDGPNLLAHTARNGVRTEYQHDDYGNPTLQIEAVGTETAATTEWTYDDAGNLQTVTDPRGHTTSYLRDAAGQVTEVVDPEGGRIVQESNATGQVTVLTDQRGHTTRYRYLVGSLLSSVRNPDGSRATLRYDSTGALEATVDELGHTTTFEYNQVGDQTAVVDPDGNRTTWEYDVLSRLTSATDATGTTTTFEYGVYEEPVVVTAGNITTRYEYDDKERVTAIIAADGSRSEMQYHEGRVVATIDPLGRRTQYAYDPEGRQNAQADPAGGTTQWRYSALGQIDGLQTPDGAITWFHHDAAGNRTAIVDPTGRETTFDFDGLNRLVSTTDNGGNSTDYSYDAAGNRVGLNDGVGQYAWEYDSRNQLIASVDPEGGRTTWIRDERGLVTTQIDTRGGETHFEYNGRRLVTQIVHPDGGIEVMDYDGAGQQTLAITGAGRQTQFEYQNGQLVTSIDPNGAETTFGYDALGRLTSVADPSGRAHTSQFDAAGQLVSETDRNGETTSYTYDLLGNRTSITDPLGHVQTFEYDALSRLVGTVRGVQSAEQVYDPASRLIARIDGEGNRTSYIYNSAGRLMTRVGPTGSQFQYAYKANGQIAATMNALGEIRRFRYDRASNLTGVMEANGEITDIFVDDAGQVVGRRPAAGLSTYYAYDSMGRHAGTKSPLGHIVWFWYDDDGLLLGQRDPNQNVVRYGYNARGELAGILWPDDSVEYFDYDEVGSMTGWLQRSGTIVSYGYDAEQRLVSSRVGGDEIQIERDPLGRPLTVTSETSQVTSQWTHGDLLVEESTDGETVGYQYDRSGRITEVDIAGTAFGRELDAAGRLSVLRMGDTVLLSIDRDALGRTSTVSYANGRQTHYAYDELGRIVEIDTPGIRTLSYSYDQRGNMLFESDSSAGITHFGYDDDDRLIRAEYGGGAVERFEYDPAGNRTMTTWGSTAVAYDSNELNQYTTADGQELNYDLNGAMTQGLAGAHDYNARGQLVGWRGASEASYGYDAAGRLNSRTVAGQTLEYLWSGAQLARIDDAVWVRSGMGEVEAIVQDGRVFFVHRDARGSTVAITDVAGDQVASYRYTAFGAPTAAVGPMATLPVPRFQGQIYDEVSGHYLTPTRRYDPRLGRFTAPDPMGAAYDERSSGNVYLALANNPNRFSDPTGLGSESWGDWQDGLYLHDQQQRVDELLGDYTARMQRLAEAEREHAFNAEVGRWRTAADANYAEVAAAPNVIPGWGIANEAWAVGNGTSTLVGEQRSRSDALGNLNDPAVYAELIELSLGGAGAIRRGLGHFARTNRAATLGGRAARAAGRSARGPGTGNLIRRLRDRLPGGTRALRNHRTAGGRATRNTADHCSPSNNPNDWGSTMENFIEDVFRKCFPAGTLVETDDGPQPIETLREGDNVLSRDVDTGEIGFQPIRQPVLRWSALMALDIVGEDGFLETIQATPDHPFWVLQQGWTEVADLLAGDELLSADGTVMQVVSLRDVGGETEVYNFEVVNWHTYYVGESRVWVHNSECPGQAYAPLPTNLTAPPRPPRSLLPQMSGRRPTGFRTSTQRDIIANQPGLLHERRVRNRRGREVNRFYVESGYDRSHVVSDNVSNRMIDYVLAGQSRDVQERILRTLDRGGQFGYSAALSRGESIEQVARRWRRDNFNRTGNVVMGPAADNQADGRDFYLWQGANLMDPANPRVDAGLLNLLP